MHWLAWHYLAVKKPREAERVARAAAAVGSELGLDVLGTVLEGQGQLREAEKVFREIDVRYNHRMALDLFYLRAQHRDGGERYEEAAKGVLARLFPQGLERVTLSDFNAPPKHGVRIQQDSAGARSMELAAGDVIVALDGYRVRNDIQYEAVRDLGGDHPIRLIAWSPRRGGYVAAEGRFDHRRAGLELENYVAAP
jgi:hypothetical protein